MICKIFLCKRQEKPSAFAVNNQITQMKFATERRGENFGGTGAIQDDVYCSVQENSPGECKFVVIKVDLQAFIFA